MKLNSIEIKELEIIFRTCYLGILNDFKRGDEPAKEDLNTMSAMLSISVNLITVDFLNRIYEIPLPQKSIILGTAQKTEFELLASAYLAANELRSSNYMEHVYRKHLENCLLGNKHELDALTYEYLQFSPLKQRLKWNIRQVNEEIIVSNIKFYENATIKIKTNYFDKQKKPIKLICEIHRTYPNKSPKRPQGNPLIYYKGAIGGVIQFYGKGKGNNRFPKSLDEARKLCM